MSKTSSTTPDINPDDAKTTDRDQYEEALTQPSVRRQSSDGEAPGPNYFLAGGPSVNRMFPDRNHRA